MNKKNTKDYRISKEIKKLEEIFKNIPEDKKKLAKSLIENAAFMTITLEDLQKQINDEGAVITATNGNGFNTVLEHPAQKSYNTMINRFSSVIKQLSEMLPDNKSAMENKAGENLAMALAKGKGIELR